jgi:hypothetical protein
MESMSLDLLAEPANNIPCAGLTYPDACLAIERAIAPVQKPRESTDRCREPIKCVEVRVPRNQNLWNNKRPSPPLLPLGTKTYLLEYLECVRSLRFLHPARVGAARLELAQVFLLMLKGLVIISDHFFKRE